MKRGSGEDTLLQPPRTLGNLTGVAKPQVKRGNGEDTLLQPPRTLGNLAQRLNQPLEPDPTLAVDVANDDDVVEVVVETLDREEQILHFDLSQKAEKR